MKKASKRRILFAARMATMVGAACFAVSGISETLGQEKEKSRPVYIATEEVAETTYTPEVEEATQPTETAKAVETEEPLIASMDWDKDDSYLLCKIAMAEAESEGVKGKALVMLVVLNRVWFEVASIDGKRQWKSTDYSIYAFQKYNCSRKRKRTACILLTEIKMRLTNTTYMLYSVIDKRESEDYR